MATYVDLGMVGFPQRDVRIRDRGTTAEQQRCDALRAQNPGCFQPCPDCTCPDCQDCPDCPEGTTNCAECPPPAGWVPVGDCPQVEKSEAEEGGFAWWWLLVAAAGGGALGYALGAKKKAVG